MRSSLAPVHGHEAEGDAHSLRHTDCVEPQSRRKASLGPDSSHGGKSAPSRVRIVDMPPLCLTRHQGCRATSGGLGETRQEAALRAARR